MTKMTAKRYQELKLRRRELGKKIDEGDRSLLPEVYAINEILRQNPPTQEMLYASL